MSETCFFDRNRSKSKPFEKIKYANKIKKVELQPPHVRFFFSAKKISKNWFFWSTATPPPKKKHPGSYALGGPRGQGTGHFWFEFKKGERRPSEAPPPPCWQRAGSTADQLVNRVLVASRAGAFQASCFQQIGCRCDWVGTETRWVLDGVKVLHLRVLESVVVVPGFSSWTFGACTPGVALRALGLVPGGVSRTFRRKFQSVLEILASGRKSRLRAAPPAAGLKYKPGWSCQ